MIATLRGTEPGLQAFSGALFFLAWLWRIRYGSPQQSKPHNNRPTPGGPAESPGKAIRNWYRRTPPWGVPMGQAYPIGHSDARRLLRVFTTIAVNPTWPLRCSLGSTAALRPAEHRARPACGGESEVAPLFGVTFDDARCLRRGPGAPWRTAWAGPQEQRRPEEAVGACAITPAASFLRLADFSDNPQHGKENCG